MTGPLDKWMQPHLLDVPPYVPVEPPDEVAAAHRHAGRPHRQARRQREPLRAVAARWLRRWRKPRRYHIYPDPEQRRVRKALGRYVGFDPEWVIAGAGSDELIDLLVRLFVPPGECDAELPADLQLLPLPRRASRAPASSTSSVARTSDRYARGAGGRERRTPDRRGVAQQPDRHAAAPRGRGGAAAQPAGPSSSTRRTRSSPARAASTLCATRRT